ncbi:hypothetical protein MCERE19_03777 [Spirosomataceae bacterium]
MSGLCNSVEVIKDANGNISSEKATLFLDATLVALQSRYATYITGTLTETQRQAIITSLVGGNCNGFATGLSGIFSDAANGTFVGFYNNTVISQYGNVIREILGALNIEQPIELQVSLNYREEPSCGLNDGSIILNINNGTSPFRYSKDNGATYQTSPTFESLAEGNYTFLVKDAKDNSGTFSYALTAKVETAPELIPTVMEDLSAPGGRLKINGAEFYIAPNGKAVSLPLGATPAFFKFSGSWASPPTGTLQGFKIGNDYYFADITNQGHFRGYRSQSLCPPSYNTVVILSATPTGQVASIYLKPYIEGNKCGYKELVFNHQFSTTPNNQTTTLSEPTTVVSSNVSWNLLDCDLNNKYVDDYASYIANLQYNDACVFLIDKRSGKVYKVENGVKTLLTGTTPAQAKQQIIDKNFGTACKIGVAAEWDGTNWDITHDFKDGALQIPTSSDPEKPYTGTIEQVKAKSDAAVEKVKKNGIPTYTGSDGELVYQGMGIVEAVIEVKNATLDLCNNAKVPEKYWDETPSKIKAPTLSGVGDGAINEIKDIPELVVFGLQIATEPEVAKGIWVSIKGLTPTKVKKMLLGAAAEKLGKYTGPVNTMKHEVGKDGVTIAMMFFTGGAKKIKDGLDLMDDVAEGVGKKMNDFGETISDGLGKNVSEEAREVTLKGINDGDISKEFAEEINEEFKDATTKADKAWMENIIKGVKYGKRIDAKFDADDLDYLTEAANEIGNGMTAAELKTFKKANQLQINLGNGDFTVADNVWFKQLDADNFEVIINETKLSSGTNLTTRQNQFKNALTGGTTSFGVRSIKNNDLAGKNIIVKSFIRTNGNGSISDVFNCEKLFKK